MSTDMALDELDSQKIKELEKKTIRVNDPENGPNLLREKLNQIWAKKDENQETDYWIKFVFNQLQSLIRVDLKEPISIRYHNIELRPAPTTLKDMMQTFLIEHGSTKDQFKDSYFQNRQIKLSASISGESLPLPPDPEIYAYEVLSRPMPETPSYLAQPKVSEIGMFSRGTKGEPGQQTIEHNQPTPPTKGMKGG